MDGARSMPTTREATPPELLNQLEGLGRGIGELMGVLDHIQEMLTLPPIAPIGVPTAPNKPALVPSNRVEHRIGVVVELQELVSRCLTVVYRIEEVVRTI